MTTFVIAFVAGLIWGSPGFAAALAALIVFQYLEGDL